MNSSSQNRSTYTYCNTKVIQSTPTMDRAISPLSIPSSIQEPFIYDEMPSGDTTSYSDTDTTVLLRHENQNLLLEIKKLQMENLELRTKGTAGGKVREQLESLSMDNIRLWEENERLQNEKNQLEHVNRRIVDDLEQERRISKLLDLRLEELTQQIKTLEIDYNSLVSVNEEQLESISLLKEQEELKNAKMEMLQGLVKALEKDLKALRKVSDTSMAEFALQQEKNELLSAKLKELEDQIHASGGTLESTPARKDRTFLLRYLGV